MVVIEITDLDACFSIIRDAPWLLPPMPDAATFARCLVSRDHIAQHAVPVKVVAA